MNHWKVASNSFVYIILLILVLPVGVITQTNNGVFKDENRIVREWVRDNNTKLPKNLQSALSGKFVDRKGKFTAWGKPPSPDLIKEMGADFNPQERRAFKLNGRTYWILQYGKSDEDNSRQDLYIRQDGTYKKILTEGECGSIDVISLGDKGPVFIADFKSGCGSGWVGYLNLPNPDGSLREVLHFGGWHASHGLMDIDGDGVCEFFNNWDLLSVPNEIGKRLAKLPKFDSDWEVAPGGFSMSCIVAYKWNGKKFVKLGDFYRSERSYGEFNQ